MNLDALRPEFGGEILMAAPAAYDHARRLGRCGLSCDNTIEYSLVTAEGETTEVVVTSAW